jgi:hypothetical protein
VTALYNALALCINNLTLGKFARSETRHGVRAHGSTSS